MAELQEDSSVIGTLSPANLSDETKRIISSIGLDQVQVFDLTRNDSEPLMVRLWVEVFEGGVKQTDVLGIGMGRGGANQVPNSKNQVLFSYDFKEDENSKERSIHITASVLDGTGSSSTEGKVALTGKSGGRLTSPLNSTRELELNQPITVLAVIEDDGDSVSFNDRELQEYDRLGQEPKGMLEYDRLILFRVKLMEEN